MVRVLVHVESVRSRAPIVVGYSLTVEEVQTSFRAGGLTLNEEEERLEGAEDAGGSPALPVGFLLFPLSSVFLFFPYLPSPGVSPSPWSSIASASAFACE